jgi:hypothetical protein
MTFRRNARHDEVFVNGKRAALDNNNTGVLAGQVLLHKPTPDTCS